MLVNTGKLWPCSSKRKWLERVTYPIYIGCGEIESDRQRDRLAINYLLQVSKERIARKGKSWSTQWAASQQFVNKEVNIYYIDCQNLNINALLENMNGWLSSFCLPSFKLIYKVLNVMQIIQICGWIRYVKPLCLTIHTGRKTDEQTVCETKKWAYRHN